MTSEPSEAVGGGGSITVASGRWWSPSNGEVGENGVVDFGRRGENGFHSPERERERGEINVGIAPRS